MRRLAPLAPAGLALLLSACASAGAPGAAAPEGLTRTMVTQATGGTADVELFVDRSASRQKVGGQPAAVLSALPLAYAEVGFEGAGPVQGRPQTVGAVVPKLRRTLGKTNLSRYLDCGRTAAGLENADVQLVRMTVTTEVKAVDGGSEIATQVSATSTSVENSNYPVDCSSKGVLELRIAEALTSRLGR